MKKIMLIIIMLMLASMVTAEKQKLFQNYPLTDELIIQALEEGAKEKGKFTGLKIKAEKGLWGTINFNVWSELNRFKSGIEIFTPYTWITWQASQNAEKYLTMEKSQITKEMSASVLRIFSPQVNHIVIRTTNKEEFSVIQPIEMKLDSDAMESHFSIKEVGELSELDEKGEFFIVLIKDDEEKKYKVKTKHFKKLP